MSVDQPKNTTKIWDGVIEYDEPVPDAKTEAVKADIELKLAGFSGHKEQFLSLLHDAHDRGPQTEPFDEDKSWFGVEATAYQYFWRERAKQEIMSRGDCETRYRAIADVLKPARSLVEEAAQSPDLANDLIWAWWEGTKEYAEAAGQFVDLLHIEREFNKVVTGLAALEAAALRAAEEVHPGRGRPVGAGAALAPGYVLALAGVYRKNTEVKPGMERDGPFARFVREFLDAVGQEGRISERHLVEIIEDACTQACENPSGWASSPFDE